MEQKQRNFNAIEDFDQVTITASKASRSRIENAGFDAFPIDGINELFFYLADRLDICFERTRRVPYGQRLHRSYITPRPKNSLRDGLLAPKEGHHGTGN